MLNCACDSGRAHGLLQFYGANRTGRWAGRLIQVQNLPRNYLNDLGLARKIIRTGDYDLATMLFGDDTGDLLSQLIRTAFKQDCSEGASNKTAAPVARCPVPLRLSRGIFS